MYELLKKYNSHETYSDGGDSKSIRTRRSHRSNSSNKTRLIRKHIENTISKAKQELKQQLMSLENKLGEIILEIPESEESSLKIDMDDGEKSVIGVKFSENLKLGTATEMASKTLPVVGVKPNELSDEELPEISKVKVRKVTSKSKMDAEI